MARFQPHHLDEIRARLPVSQVVARKVALKKKGREYAGLSPFKTEKTPSFFVNDQKGFYHCFASGEHGDIFTFVMKTEGLSFPEAVERLAEEAGVDLPKPTPRDAKVADERERLAELVEISAVYFEQELRSPAGRHARQYLERRGLTPAAIKSFRIGYAPASRTSLKQFLEARGFTLVEMAKSGMLIAGDDIAVPYDRFRDRVMFPIRNAKGRAIAFGGRALDPSVPAKYLNSPETPLFHKGHVLFNVHAARPHVFEKQRIIAVEGYMDVVALAQAGFEEAVAPLGTALTIEQLTLMWRMTPEPVLCFDGDEAGRKAAFRAIDTALPHLKAGISLRFAFLPDGQDPDDLVKDAGATGFDAVLRNARPLFDVLFEREWRSGSWDTPERRAKLETGLRNLVGQIGDPTVRNHYEREMRSRLFEAWREMRPKTAIRQHRGRGQYPARQARGARPQGANSQALGRFPQTHATAGEDLKKSALANGLGKRPPPREALILKTVLNHPWLIDDHAEILAALEFSSSAARKLRDAVLSVHALKNPLDRTNLAFHLEQTGQKDLVEVIAQSSTHRNDPFAEPEADPADVEAGWADLLRLQDGHAQVR